MYRALFSNLSHNFSFLFQNLSHENYIVSSSEKWHRPRHFPVPICRLFYIYFTFPVWHVHCVSDVYSNNESDVKLVSLSMVSRSCMAWACHTPQQPLQNHPSGRLGRCATPRSAEEMLGGQHQRVDIPAHARTAQNGLLQKGLEENIS